MNWYQRIGNWVSGLGRRELARVEAVPVGRPNDGLSALASGPMGANDRDYGDMQAQYGDVTIRYRGIPLLRASAGH